MKLMRVIFVGQLLFMLPAWLAFVSQPASLGTLYVALYVVALGLGFGALAVWLAWKKPAARGLAFVSVLTTVACLSTPFLMDAFALPPVPVAVLIVLGVLLAIVAVGFLLAKRKRWLPGKAFPRQKFNYGVLAAIATALVLIWAPPLIWLAMGYGAELGENRSNDNATRGAFLIYYSAVALPALIVATFTSLFAIAGIIRSAGSRLFHVGQLAGSALLLSSLGLVAVGIGFAMVNPG